MTGNAVWSILHAGEYGSRYILSRLHVVSTTDRDSATIADLYFWSLIVFSMERKRHLTGNNILACQQRARHLPSRAYQPELSSVIPVAHSTHDAPVWVNLEIADLTQTDLNARELCFVQCKSPCCEGMNPVCLVTL